MNRPSLNEQVTNSYRRAFQGGYDNAAQHWKKGLLAIMVTVVSVCTWELVAGRQGILAERKRQAQNTGLATENQSLTRQVADLAEQNRELATSDFVAEKTIRETLLRARPGEVVYLFNETPTANNTPLTFDDVIIVPTPPKKDPKETPASH
ncbi:MAG: hypothetical protein SGI90_10815 [Candidatus Eisenbacteria bacterium]|nr:hypothetical protein [Candidatus Eisenbacteria bacterium]